MQEFVELSSNEGDVVLDAFCGSGTLAIACIILTDISFALRRIKNSLILLRNGLKNGSNNKQFGN